ncbi:Glycosylphosphatidylinositol specific phospholipase D1 [Mortierella claussenii]|nr:Glycosylphosphatidylinositol specific phospholipase D1 [Mortierella claussenii]
MDAYEKAHWPPFTEASVRYILETYPRPWTDHAKALIAFLFGTVSHSLGDMSWHALQGLDAGFIKALADTSFQGDYSKGHTLADIGAEFVLSHMSKMDHLVTKWKVPVKDISEIYRRMGYKVPGPVLSHCMRNGYAGAQANARLGSQLFPVYASKSPFLIEQVEDYPMGGLRDMAEWTVDCWNGLAGYLDKERKLPDDDDRKANRTFNMCYALWEGRTKNGQKDAGGYSREGDVLHQHEHRHGSANDGAFAMMRLNLAGLRVLSDTDENTGMITFSIAETDRDIADTPEAAKSLEQQQQQQNQKRQEAVVEVEEQERRQGQKIIDDFGELIYQNSQQKLLWRPHRRGREMQKGEKTFNDPEQGSGVCLSFSDELESHAHTLFLPVEYASFGHATATGDFDGDGHMDLAVAAPHMHLNPLVPSQGAVYIIPGQSLLATVDEGDQGESGTDVRTVASSVLYGDASEPQSRFGWSMAVVDMNQDGIDDLAIGAPGHGAKDLKYDGSVFVYFGRRGEGLREQPDLVINHDRAKNRLLDVPPGMDTLEGLGRVMQGLDLTGSGFKDLVIGMPTATAAIKQSTAAVGPRLSHGGTKVDDDDENEAKKARFRSQAGKVLVFLSAAKHTGQKLDTERDWELQGSPTLGFREEEAMRGKIEGFLIPEYSKQSLSGGSFEPLASQPIFTIHGDSKFQQLGSSLAGNRHLSSLTQSEDQEYLIVGSQSEDILQRLPRVGRRWQAGMVRIVDISQLADGSEVKISELDSNPDIVRDSLQGSQSMAHLSAAMEVSTDGQSLWLTEPYAKAEAGRILEWVPNFDKGEDGGDLEKQKTKVRRRKNVLGVRGRQLVHTALQGGDGDDDDEDDNPNQERIRQCFIGSDFRGRFGSQLLVADLNTDGVDDIVVASSHASQYATMAGTVTVKFRS